MWTLNRIESDLSNNLGSKMKNINANFKATKQLKTIYEKTKEIEQK